MISLTKRKKLRPGLLGIETLGVIYALFTLAVALVFYDSVPMEDIILTRVVYALVMTGLIFLYRARPCHLTFFLRIVFQLIMTGSWYPETYLFCRIFGNFDHIFASIDQTIFSMQPALLFSKKFSGIVWSELFDLGYFSYYPMIIALVIWVFFRRYLYFERFTFIILCSFFIYYLVFMFLPVAGPQYYYPAVGVDTIRNGIFPAIGHYFRDSFPALTPAGGDRGLFGFLVSAVHSAGERPTAAFPSSHVGISTIVMILAWKARGHRRLFYIFLPFYILLCLSTVYTQAHYAVDAIAGLLTAYPVYRISRALYYTGIFHRPSGYHS